MGLWMTGIDVDVEYLGNSRVRVGVSLHDT